MILKIGFEAEKEIVVPKYYNHTLQGFFYENIDKVLRNLIHNQGFAYGSRKFKLFTFSKIMAKLKEKKQKELVFEPPITIYFATPISDLFSSVLNMTFRKHTLNLGKNRLYASSIETIKPKANNKEKLICLSPVVVYKTPIGERRFYYLSPHEEEFYKLIISNLYKKYQIVYSKNYKGEMKLYPIKVKPSYRKKVLYKNTLIVGWEGIFGIEAEPDMLELALTCGIGVKNSAGFGMVKPLREGKDA